MKKIIYASIFMTLSSFSIYRNEIEFSSQPGVPGTTQPLTERVVGTLQLLGKDNCRAIIKVNNKGVVQKFVPTNLEEKYYVDGIRLKFAYVKSTDAMPKDCRGEAYISVSDVTSLR